MNLQNPYCSLEDVQAETGNTKPDAVGVLLGAINNASRFIESETGRDFLYHDHRTSGWIAPVEAVGGTYITLPWPCIVASEVTVTIDGVAVDPSEYRVLNDPTLFNCYLIRCKPWVADEPGRVGLEQVTEVQPVIEVRGQFGYVEAAENPQQNPSPALPGTVRYACTVIAAVRSGKAKREAVGSDGSVSTLVQKNIPKDVDSILRRMRLRSGF